MRWKTRTLLPFCVVVLSATAAPSAGGSTREQTLQLGPSGSGVRQLIAGPGEPFAVRRARGTVSKLGRASRRHSLLYFAHLTDPHTVDEMSPGRAEFLDPAGPGAALTHRPHEALSTHVLDQMVRAVNRHRVSRQSGAPMAFALMTGDASDNAQLNEARWYIRALDGGVLDPFSGRPVGAGNPCPGAGAHEVRALNASVAARQYVGVQRHVSYAGGMRFPKSWFWDPDTGAQAGRYAGVRYPGLMDRAQEPFQAEGLAVPWYAARGNHDSAKQGDAPTHNAYFLGRSTGCRKVFPGAFNPRRLAGVGHRGLFTRLGRRPLLAALRRDTTLVPPDPARRPVSKREFKLLHGSTDGAHGFRFVARGEARRSRGAASYYAFTPRAGFRFISLDTTAEAGGASGNVDHPQYRWLVRELRRNRKRKRLVVVFAHHTLTTMNNKRHDEQAPRCRPGLGAACDGDPRGSRPLHHGTGGRQPLRSLLLRHRHVVAFVAGHSHRNHVRAFARRDGRGAFWQINTASHIDFPQQSRLIELMSNRDGTLSIFGTILDHAAPLTAPPPGTPARNIGHAGLGSLSRALSAPGSGGTLAGLARGRRADRNVELLLRDPRR